MASRHQRRLHTPEPGYPPLAPGPLSLTAEDSHYILGVLRLQAGDAVTLFDGRGNTAESVLTPPEAGRRARAVLNIVALGVAPLPKQRVHVAVPPPKGERTDWMVEKLTELGVHAIHWLRTDYSDAKADRLRPQRLERLMGAAARQAGIDRLPVQHDPQTLAECVAVLPKAGGRFVAHPRAPSLLSVPAPPNAVAISVVIGPEGGLSSAELQLLEAHRFVPVGLSAHVLRVETAALVAAAALLLRAPG